LLRRILFVKSCPGFVNPGLYFIGSYYSFLFSNASCQASAQAREIAYYEAVKQSLEKKCPQLVSNFLRAM